MQSFTADIRKFLEFYLGSSNAPVPFGGRQQDLTELTEWLDDNQSSPYLLLIAPAGRGKSALLARWVKSLCEREDLNILYFPISLRFSTNQAEGILSALTFRLAFLTGKPLEKASSGLRYWMELFLDYLRKQDKKNLLVIDGLDESSGWPWGEAVLPLTADSTQLRIVVAARSRANEQGIETWKRDLGLEGTAPGLTTGRSLEMLSKEGLRDVLVQMKAPLEKLAEKEEVVDQLYRLSDEGDPLLVKLYVDALFPKKEETPTLIPEDLKKLTTPGLSGYFQQWWAQQEKLWEQNKADGVQKKELLRFLRLLSLALGPLRTEDLGTLNKKLKLFSTKQQFNKALDLLKRFISGEGERSGFALSHPRLGYFFIEEWQKELKEENWGGDWKEEWEKEKAALENGFLEWGKETLAKLADGALASDKAPAYVVRHYRVHLENTGRPIMERSALACPAWFHAWEVLGGGFSGFLDDLEAIWREIQKANNSAVELGKEAPYLEEEVRCLVCASSLRSLAENLPVSLLVAFVRKGKWTPARALAVARQQSIQDRVNALGQLAQEFEAEERIGIIQEALSIARTIQDEKRRADTLTALALHLLPEERPGVIQEAFSNARKIRNIHSRIEALRRLIPYLTLDQLNEVLSIAQTSRDEFLRVDALIVRISHLSSQERPRALKEVLSIAQTIRSESFFRRTLCALAPHLSFQDHSRVLLGVLNFILTTSDEQERISLLRILGPLLSPEQLNKALSITKTIKNEQYHAMALGVIVPHLPPQDRPRVIQDALSMSRKQSEHDRVDILRVLIPHLSLEQLNETLSTVRTSRNAQFRADTLRELSPHLSSDQLNEALSLARVSQDILLRMKALAVLIPYLSSEERSRVIQEVLSVAQASQNDQYRVSILSFIIPHLLPGDRSRAIQDILSIAQTSPNEYSRVSALSVLVLHVPQEQLNEVLPVAQTIKNEQPRARALGVIIPYVSPQARTGVIQAILPIARKSPSVWILSGSLRAIAPYLAQEQLNESLSIALTRQHEQHRADILREIAPYLSQEQLNEALTIARTSQHTAFYVQTLAAIIPHLLLQERSKVIQEVLSSPRISDSWSRASALGVLAPHLSSNQLNEALSVTWTIPDEQMRASIFGNLIPYLSSEQLNKASSLARIIQHERYRAEALAKEIQQAKKRNHPFTTEMISDWLAFQSEGWTAFPGEVFQDSPCKTLYAFWKQAFRFNAPYQRKDLLTIFGCFVPLLVLLGGHLAPGKIAQVIIETADGWS
jgi:uncharacterized protein YeeX (DUF496 family)